MNGHTITMLGTPSAMRGRMMGLLSVCIGTATPLGTLEMGVVATAFTIQHTIAVNALLGLAGFGRVDLMLDSSSGELFVLEADPVPGLTETSLLPQAADAAGIGFDELIERILAAALVRF